jgi:hypothetical protein
VEAHCGQQRAFGDLYPNPLMAATCGWADLLGLERTMGQDKGRPLAGKSTLNFAELRYQTLKIWSCERRVIGRSYAKGHHVCHRLGVVMTGISFLNSAR